jgi:dihydroxyacetone kinase
MLNGLGGTKYEELFVLYKDVAASLGDAGVEIVLPEVGELVTSLDMAGCSLTLFWLDEELEDLWAAPADTPAFRRGSVGEVAVTGARVDAAAKLAQAEEEAGTASAESEAAAERVRAALAATLAVLEANEGELGRLDSVAGDGDHGSGMVRGARAAVEAANADGGGAGTVLRRAGQAWGDRAGGTSGALWGAMLERLGAALGDQERPTAQAVADGVREAAATVQRIGQANPGDKTLLDALLPFVDALAERVGRGDALADAWTAAAPAADDAARQTAELTAKVGRARPLGDRSLGTPDPGAVSLALIVAAVGETLR